MNANYITAYLMPEMPIAASSLLLFSGLPCGGKTNETEMFRYAANSSQTVMYLLRSHRRPISSHGVPIPVLFLSSEKCGVIERIFSSPVDSRTDPMELYGCRLLLVVGSFSEAL